MATIRTAILVSLVSASVLLGLFVTGTACAAESASGVIVMPAAKIIGKAPRCIVRDLVQGSGSVRVCS